jgi:hypothetical protein
MHTTPHLWFRRGLILSIACLLLNYFLTTSCSTYQSDRKQSEAFLTKLLLENGGIYTLFGDKPITGMLIFCGNPEDLSLEGLSEETLRNVIFVEDYTPENYASWKRFSKGLKFTKFRLIEQPCANDPLQLSYMLVNLNNVRNLLQSHQKTFQEHLKMVIDAEQILQQLDQPSSAFWSTVFKDHYLAGLLYGFDEESIRQFDKTIRSSSVERNRFSDDHSGFVSIESFPLPVYAIFPGDTRLTEYAKQREQIQKLYKGRDFMEVTLRRMTEKP